MGKKNNQKMMSVVEQWISISNNTVPFTLYQIYMKFKKKKNDKTDIENKQQQHQNWNINEITEKSLFAG